EACRQQPRHDARESGCPAFGLHGRHFCIRDCRAAGTQAGAKDADHVRGGEALSVEPCEEFGKTGRAEGRLQLGQRAEGKAEPVLAAIQRGLDFTARGVDAHPASPASPNRSSPADSRAISNAISPSCAPEYSSATIWNGPDIAARPGISISQQAIVSPRKRLRMARSEAASLKMPAPAIDARFMPLPANSS